MDKDAARIEDLEEALRRIVTVVADARCYPGVIDRDLAVINIALDSLGLDMVPFPAWH